MTIMNKIIILQNSSDDMIQHQRHDNNTDHKYNSYNKYDSKQIISICHIFQHHHHKTSIVYQ